MRYRGVCLWVHSLLAGGQLRPTCAHRNMTLVKSACLFPRQWNEGLGEEAGELLEVNCPPGGFIGQCDEILLALTSDRDCSHLTLTCSVLQRTPLYSHFCNRSDKRAVSITLTDEVYNFVCDFLDRVSIIPYVFSRLGWGWGGGNCQSGVSGNTNFSLAVFEQ